MTDGLDPRLEERLERLRPDGGGGDWLDVHRRAEALAAGQRSGRRRSLLLLAAALAVALAVAIPAAGIGDRLLGLFSVARETSEDVPPVPPSGEGDADRPELPAYVHGDRLAGVPGRALRLARPLFAPLLGATGAYAPQLAVPAPDGSSVVYHATRGTTPLLRLVDVASGDDRLLARGGQSVAWGSDGTLAYWQADPPRYRPQRPFLGHVVVRRSPDARPVRWTRAGEYTVFAWAGESLLVVAGDCVLEACPRDLPEGGLYALGGPGRSRPLGLATLTAVSPDGRYAVGPQAAGHDNWSPVVRVVEVATGRTVARLNPRDAAETGATRALVEFGVGEGSWVGDRIVAVARNEGGAALVVFRFADGELELDGVLRLDDEEALGGAAGAYFSSPIFLDQAGDYVAVRANVSESVDEFLPVFLMCSLESETCARGRLLTEPRRWLALVHNPSRPLDPAARTLASDGT